MIVQPINRNVQVSDAMQRTRATMLASPEMLRRAILPYTKLELAAVRETINNAADSSTKLAIQIPTKLEPVVRIRDYGPGIPVAQIYNFYSVAGYSTKTQTNVTTDANGNEIHVMGCKGVGRFAPLGVTEQFTFHNYTAGRCIVGQVFFDSEGYPTVDILDDSESNEPSGVEISFAVDPAHINAFRVAFHDCLVNFPDHYEVTFLGEPIDIIKPQPKIHGTNWYFDEQPGIIMGRIKYEVDPTEFYDKDNLLWSMLNAGLVMRVPLGSIDVNDARESIVYNDRTKDSLIQAGKRAQAEYQSRVDAAFVACKTRWEASALYEQLSTRDTRQVFGNPKWNGMSVNAYVELRVPHNNVMTISLDVGRRRRRRSTTSTDPELPKWLSPRGRAGKDALYHVYPSGTVVILVDDEKNYIRRLAHAYDDPQSIIHTDVLSKLPNYGRNLATVFIYDTAKVRDILDAMGGAAISLKVSDLPQPPAKPKLPKSQRVAAPVVPYTFRPNYGDWVQSTAPVHLTDDTVVWCAWEDRKAVVRFDKTKHPTIYEFAEKCGLVLEYQYAKTMFNVLETLGLSPKYTFVALTKPLQAKVGKSKWRAFADVFEESLVAHIADPAVRRAYGLACAASNGGWDSPHEPFLGNRGFKFLEALDLPTIYTKRVFNYTANKIPESWRDDDFPKQVEDALVDRPLFKYLAQNAPEEVIINYLKEGK